MRSLMATWAAILLASPAAATARGRGDDAPRAYTLELDMDMQLKAPSGSLSTVKGQMTLRYGLKPTPEGLEVSIDEMGMTTRPSDGPESRFRISRDAVLDERGGKEEELTRDRAAPRVRAMLDTFGAPMAVITLDAEGGEVGRKVLVRSGPLAVPGVADNAMAFRVRFPRDATLWRAPVTLPMADGQVADGTLTFEKLPSQPDAPAEAPVRVRVSGELSSRAKVKGVEVKDAVYKVAGAQVYDPRGRDWTAGDWTVDLSCNMVKDGRPMGALAGVLKLSMRRTTPPPR